MKKNILLPAICAFLCILSSCQSAAGKKSDAVFTVDPKLLQYKIGDVEVQLDPAMRMGKIKKTAVAVLYVLEEDAVILRYKHEFMNYQMCWSRDGRQLFIDALKKYNEDYDARVLELKDGKSLRKYGSGQGYLIWQMMNYTVRAEGKMNIQLGYTFKDRAPYFTVRQLKAEYIDKNSRTRNSESTPITYYFTRSQAAELAALFDPEFIDGLNIISGPSRLDPYVEQDEY